MSITIPLPQIQLTPGSQISVSGLSWQDFEDILQELGEKRNTRLSYYQSTLEIMSPSAAHERPNRIIAYIVTTILEELGQDWEDFGSTTLKLPETVGVEPDTCFYIQNATRARNYINLDLSQSLPPDLAIECDVTSKTKISAYQALKVPEIWIYSEDKLTIYLFSSQGYSLSQTSLIFPSLPIIEMIPQLIEKAQQEGTRQMLQELRATLSNIS